jgi:probable phosphoglycerate mutase
MLTKNILKQRPDWELYRDGCPEGESPADVASRADRFIARVRAIDADVLAFSSAHIIRMIAARWLGPPPQVRRLFYCRPASLGVLGYEHKNREEPISAHGSTSPNLGGESRRYHLEVQVIAALTW